MAHVCIGLGTEKLRAPPAPTPAPPPKNCGTSPAVACGARSGAYRHRAQASVRRQRALVKVDADNTDLFHRRPGADLSGVRSELLQQFCKGWNLGTILEFPSLLRP
jgi:hypothetical protein